VNSRLLAVATDAALVLGIAAALSGVAGSVYPPPPKHVEMAEALLGEL